MGKGGIGEGGAKYVCAARKTLLPETELSLRVGAKIRISFVAWCCHLRRRQAC